MKSLSLKAVLILFSASLFSFSTLASTQTKTSVEAWLPQSAENPAGLWIFTGAGIGFLDSSSLNGTNNGSIANLKVTAANYMSSSPWVYEAGVGIDSTKVNGVSERASRGLFEASAKYRLINGWQAGPSFQSIIGNGEGLKTSTGDITSFLGAAVGKDFVVGKRLLRIGTRYLTDISISDSTENLVLFDVALGFATGTSKPKATTTPTTISEKVRQELKEVSSNKAIYFPSGSTYMSAQDERHLRKLARQLIKQRDLFERIELVGYSDPRGSQKINQELSLKRARAVAKTLTRLGIEESSLWTRAMGAQESEKLVDASKSSDDKSMKSSRRVELKFYGVRDESKLQQILENI